MLGRFSVCLFMSMLQNAEVNLFIFMNQIKKSTVCTVKYLIMLLDI